MFKIFHGIHLVDHYHNQKKARRESKIMSRTIKLLFCVAALIALWATPTDFFGIPGLSTVEHRVIAIFIFTTLMWILEGVPSWTTSVLATTLLLFTCSDQTLLLLRDASFAPAEEGAKFAANIIKSKDLFATFSDPIIMLFLGGFFLAIAATKTGLDVKLARLMLYPFGKKSENVLLGFILVTGIFSMFMSNTATAAMMLAFLTPVLKSLPADGKGRIALALAIPIGANVGGMGTPIGTPPNAIALKYLQDELNINISFGEWMGVMIPYVLVVLLLSWIVLRLMFPFKQKEIEIKIEDNVKDSKHLPIVCATYIVTILMWICEEYTGIGSNAVAMIPITVFVLTGVIGRRDLEEVNWSVLWMVAGGFSLGVALQQTGLAKHMVEHIPFGEWPALLMIVGAGLLCWVLSNIISNTATANLLVPILAIIGVSAKDALAPYGGVHALLVGVAMCASLAMLLPISTPPNALAHSTGLIEQKDMMRVGLIVGLGGIVLGYLMLFFVY